MICLGVRWWPDRLEILLLLGTVSSPLFLFFFSMFFQLIFTFFLLLTLGLRTG
jgi:hypothetical protein